MAIFKSFKLWRALACSTIILCILNLTPILSMPWLVCFVPILIPIIAPIILTVALAAVALAVIAVAMVVLLVLLALIAVVIILSSPLILIFGTDVSITHTDEDKEDD